MSAKFATSLPLLGKSSKISLAMRSRRSLSEAWVRGDPEARRLAARIQAAAAIVIALGIFALDVLSPLQGAVAVLYTTVILIAARGHVRRLVYLSAVICALLAIVSYAISHAGEPIASPAMRLGVSLFAIGHSTTMLLGVYF
ncbi:MAG: hypothetical protein EOP20_14770, partial [Hyphomicrobiales bacterium]